MAVGNTFGATALSSYGGFWISYAKFIYTSAPKASTSDLVLAPEHKATEELIAAAGLPAVILRNNWYTENYAADLGNEAAAEGLKKTGGFFGFLAAFLAWYCALAGIQDSR